MPDKLKQTAFQTRNDAAPMIKEMLVVIGVESYRANLDHVGNLIMQAVKELDHIMPEMLPRPHMAETAPIHN